MGTKRRRSHRSGRAPLPSPGRPPLASRTELERFWSGIANGMSSDDAAVSAGMSAPVGARWFRKAGGMPPAMFRSSTKPLSGRYLSFAEREEIALLARLPAPHALILLGLLHPFAQRLARAPNLRRDGGNRLPLRRVIGAMLSNHSDSPLTDFRRISLRCWLRHDDPILSGNEVSGKVGAVQHHRSGTRHSGEA